MILFILGYDIIWYNYIITNILYIGYIILYISIIIDIINIIINDYYEYY